MSVVYTNFFGGPFFGGGFFGAGTETGPQPDNTVGGTSAVRGRQYVERLSKREEWLERIALGILPEQISEADAAAAVAALAEIRAEKTLQPQGNEERAARQTEEAARKLYFEVYREFMLAEEITRQWNADVQQHRQNIIRAAATLLLLH